MHMADALLSPAVGGAMCAVSAGAMAYSTVKIKRDELCEKKVPLMAVAGAFVFAAQMINFTIPATGSSGHIGGGILLSGLLGGPAAMLTISMVLVIQCLFFADGGLLALGCNIFNMGVIPCLVVYPLLFRPLVRKGMNSKTIAVASILSVVTALQLGAFSVVLETFFSGIAELPFEVFVLLMQPIHLAIGLAEGVVTSAVLAFVHQARPEIMEGAVAGTRIGKAVPIKKVLVALSVCAVVAGGALSYFASSRPDGLEWAIEKTAGTAELEASGGIHEKAAELQDATVLMRDYDFSSAGEADGAESSVDDVAAGTAVGVTAGPAVAGLIGVALTFFSAFVVALGIAAAKKRKKAADAVTNA